MIRTCPLCYSPRSIPVRTMEYGSGDTQKIVACKDCGLGYASESNPADYGENSSYRFPDAIGTGDTPEDRSRLRGFVELFARVVQDRTAHILDIGCGQGGLLEELRSAGYVNISGLDPSADCVEIARKKGFNVKHGSVPGWSGQVFDVVILNHVLEHLWRINESLSAIHGLIRPEGIIYVEVPDAERYAELVYCPFLDFNHEHINHFTTGTLNYALAYNDFQVRQSGKRTFTLPGGKYPAIYSIAQPDIPEKPLIHGALTKYAAQSSEKLGAMIRGIRNRVDGREVCVWGAGEFSEVFIPALVKAGVQIRQIVDRNPSKHGKVMCGITITPPPPQPDLAVVIASVLNTRSIMRDLGKLPNEVIAAEIPSFKMQAINGEIVVSCERCEQQLDKVPDERTAYCRSGSYGGHTCL
jgi:SAM-dependent methyltransferase